MASHLMFDIDISPKLSRAGLSRSTSGIIVPDYQIPRATFESRACWSVPTSPVAAVKRQNIDQDVWNASSTIPVRHSPKRPKYTSLPSFTQSIIAPVLSPFTTKWDNGVFDGPLFEQYAGSVASQAKDAGANGHVAMSPQPSNMPPTSPSTRFPSNLFQEFAMSPPDLSTFPFCHFEQMLSPSLIAMDPQFPSADTPGSDNHTVSGCLISGCHGHELSHDQDGHPSPAVWSPSTLAAMRKQWRYMRKQPPAQTAVPLRPCLKKMSQHSTSSSLPYGMDPSIHGARTLSSSSLGVDSSFGHTDFGEDSPASLPVDVGFQGMLAGEWSAGNRSRSTSGASSTMLFSPFASDHEDGDHGSWTPQMALQILEDDELTEVEEYMLQGFLRAFSQPRTLSTEGTIEPPKFEPSFSPDAEEDLGSTPTPASVLTAQAVLRDDTVRPSPSRSRPAVSVPDSPSSSIICESPGAVEPDLPGLSQIVGHMATIFVSGEHSVNQPGLNLASSVPAQHSRSPVLDSDAEIDGEWQWACPISMPVPIRSGSLAGLASSPSDGSSEIFQTRRSSSNLPSRSNSVKSSASTTGEKRRVHFPVCPGGTGEKMALCALYPTYSATDYDRSPLEPPSEEERNCRMPERGSRDLSEEEESYLISQEEAAAWQAGHIAASSSSSITSDTQSAEYVDLYEYPVVDRDCESDAALDWSCTNDFLSTVPAEGHDPIETDDNWEDWLDRRKSPCVLHSSSSTTTLKATFAESSCSDPLLTPTNTPLDRSPFESPPAETQPGDEACHMPVPDTLQTLLDKQDAAISSDTVSHMAASSFGTSTFGSTPASDPEFGSQPGFAAGESEDLESWPPHVSNRKSQELSSEAISMVPSTSIPKVKKKKKTVSSEKRTTLWTQTQSTWGQFGSDSWSTGEEGCLGGF